MTQERNTWGVIVALGALYLIWGATYLAIRFAIETIPPFLTGSLRFLIAGGFLYVWMRWRGAVAPTRVHWRSAAIIGGLLLFGGNGGVTWAEQFVPSSLAALMIAMVPLWMVLLNWARGDRVRPTISVMLGLILGLIGIALLVGFRESESNTNPIGVIVLLCAALSWAIGSLYSRHAVLPAEPLLATAMEMLAGGVIFLIAGVGAGELGRVHLELLSERSVLALAYLTVFGSLVAFSAYIWLLKATTPARASTYAYVNPVVAVFLGWALAGEPLNLRVIIATAIIVAAVALITTRQTSNH